MWVGPGHRKSLQPCFHTGGLECGMLLLSLGLFESPWEAGGLYRGTGVRHAPAASGP